MGIGPTACSAIQPDRFKASLLSTVSSLHVLKAAGAAGRPTRERRAGNSSDLLSDDGGGGLQRIRKVSHERGLTSPLG